MTGKRDKSHFTCKCGQESKSSRNNAKIKTKEGRSFSSETRRCECESERRATQTKLNITSRDRKFASIDSIRSSRDSYQGVHHSRLNIKWACPIYIWPWKTIKRIVYASYVLNGICILYAFILFLVALQMELTIADFLNMVTRDDGYAIPITLEISSFLCFLLNIGFIFVILRSCVKQRHRLLNTFHFALVCMGVVLVVVLISLGIGCVAYPRYSKQDALHNGITKAMEMYRNDSWIKKRVDIMQITFQCCGSKTYSEWFNIPWYDTSLSGTESDKTRDDAPFSCCSRHTCYPCIHHDLMSVGSTYLYAPETNLSVSERGCYYVLFQHTQEIAWHVCVSVVFLAILELVVIIIHRFLQTAHLELYRYERNNHWHTAWLFGVYKERERAGKCVPKPPPFPYELMK